MKRFNKLFVVCVRISYQEVITQGGVEHVGTLLNHPEKVRSLVVKSAGVELFPFWINYCYGAFSGD